ncbi:hypothetical protein [Alishewanella tabrizica]|uniref:Orphan protein n=1 Tax=Alishewanella tabrizica TaxID=671278 RepID=A0ABQ2WKU6_9ALTE|nr:hypothetical protein [Alishewanella tabrizica]GGW58416.1 hypothetical protein GCM10008111_13270 [Alishewanella tabrizica]
MKDLLSVQDYLLQVSDVGDWDGEEELVADKLNTIIHVVWDALPDNLTSKEISFLMPQIWDQLRGDTVLVDVDEDELIGWAITYIQQQIDEGMTDMPAEDDEEE